MASSAFFSVLRDVTKLAAAAADDLGTQSTKLIAAADDVAALTGKAAVKTAGIAGDDLAVGAAQVSGVSPARELPVVFRIAKLSFLNKLWLAALLMAVNVAFPVAITAALVVGGLYLAYEGAHAALEMFSKEDAVEEAAPLSEDEKVKGAVRTDLILSLEILVISLSAVAGAPWAHQLMVLLAMSLVMTVAVYGLIAVLIRLDDMGLSLARSGAGWRQRVGTVMAQSAPRILKLLGPVGMVAMLAVSGGIFTHLLHVQVASFLPALAFDVAAGLGVGLMAVGALSLFKKLKIR